MAVVRDLEKLNADIQEQKERVENVDFKMITFSLGGKDYGVDIMNVKEIAKADKFTFVPNAASYVRGVYNLRGDIIPIIDLRSFFHLAVHKREESMQNMLILQIEDRIYGTIVDKIDKVIGISSESIQPPHPIFGDINIKFISGVVEKDGDLYIILDVVRIFSINKDDDAKGRRSDAAPIYNRPIQETTISSSNKAIGPAESDMDFIRQSLPALRGFYPSLINERWIRERFLEWNRERRGQEQQLKNIQDADEYLSRFFSPATEGFWDEDYALAVKAALPVINSSIINVWNIGCGKGYETYSFACILKTKYTSARFKIWANDGDIMAISQAPSMVFQLDEVPEYCRTHMVRGTSGYTFNQEIKDAILFEYHDITNDNALPDLDIILARDVLSFISPDDQSRLVLEFSDKLKTQGLVFLGTNEELPDTEWRSTAKQPVTAYTRK
jgi:purine-binding chemotaxis protein CheW